VAAPVAPAPDANAAAAVADDSWFTGDAEGLKHTFLAKTASIKGVSPLKELFVKVSADDPEVTALELASHAEMPLWLPQRQSAALELLAHNTRVARVNLAGANIGDAVCEALARALRSNRSVLFLSLERNELREAGLLALAAALPANGTLRELKLAHQKAIPSTAVEDALADAVEGCASLTKLGLAVRNERQRKRIEAALFRNADAARKRRLAAAQAEPVDVRKSRYSRSASPEAPRKKHLNAQYSGIAQASAPHRKGSPLPQARQETRDRP
jgi:hypothetical protein